MTTETPITLGEAALKRARNVSKDANAKATHDFTRAEREITNASERGLESVEMVLSPELFQDQTAMSMFKDMCYRENVFVRDCKHYRSMGVVELDWSGALGDNDGQYTTVSAGAQQ